MPALEEVQESETRYSRQHLSTNTQTWLSEIQHSSSSVALSGGALDARTREEPGVFWHAADAKGSQPPARTKGKRHAWAPPRRSAPRLQGTGQALPQPGLPTLLVAAQHQLTAACSHCRQRGSRNKAHKPVLFYVSQPLQVHAMFYCMLQQTDMNKAADSQTTDGSCNCLFSTPTPLGLSFLNL